MSCLLPDSALSAHAHGRPRAASALNVVLENSRFFILPFSPVIRDAGSQNLTRRNPRHVGEAWPGGGGTLCEAWGAAFFGCVYTNKQWHKNQENIKAIRFFMYVRHRWPVLSLGLKERDD
ncbi:hypothetical protein SRHO_G00201280 [Serrasalmus rhombeus]